MTLFDNFTRTDFSYKSHTEPVYNFYNRAALPQFTVVRDRLEKWFSVYPSEATYELKRRFEKEFASAYYELFLYILFLENGYTIKLHPDVPGSSKKPDFLITKGKISAYVEARVVHEVSANESSIRNLKRRIYDKINEIQSDYFHINIETLDVLNMSKAPSLREINEFIQNALDQVDYHSYLNNIQKNNGRMVQNTPHFDLKTSTVHLSFSVLPKRIPSTGKVSKLIGIYADEGKAQMVNPSPALIKALKEKGRRYGTLDKPFIIAINALSVWVTYEEDYTIALFGGETLAFDSINRVYLSAQGTEGFFIDSKGFTYSRVSGVLFTKAYDSSIAGSKVVFYHHPKAANPIDPSFLDVEQKFLEEGALKTIKGKSTASLFNIHQEDA